MTREAVLRQALLLWAAAFAAIIAVSLLAPPPWAKVTAVVAFLYLPLAAMRRTGEDARDYGATLARWRTDVPLALGLLAVVAPLFVLGYHVWLGHALPRHHGAPAALTFNLRVPAGYGWTNVVDGETSQVPGNHIDGSFNFGVKLELRL